jgi:flagellar L-ring protein precursor FlgH
MKHLIFVCISVLIPVWILSGCGANKAQVKDPTALQEYVKDAAKTTQETEAGTGSLWRSNGYRSDLFRDAKARYVNDVVTIRVLETTQAVASADASSARDTSLTAGFDNLFGAEKLIREIPTMVSGQSSSSFEGKGATRRVTTLQTSLTARVTDVLPNGYLVVEGKREISVNNENQSVFLTGVVRPQDIQPDNTVFSSAVAQMSVRVQGRGVVSQPIKPGWLYKILNGILPF